ncbi:hypothetical protein H5410_057953, partial [Solanum commersonii]
MLCKQPPALPGDVRSVLIQIVHSKSMLHTQHIILRKDVASIPIQMLHLQLTLHTLRSVSSEFRFGTGVDLLAMAFNHSSINSSVPLMPTSASLSFLPPVPFINNIVALMSSDTCSHQYSTNMATESELANQTVPINKIPKNSVNSVIRVLVIRRGSITPYKNSRHEGTYRTIILVDEEGIKIQATLFNKHIETWKDFLKPNKSYYIAKGRYNRVNPNYSSVHKEVELAFTDNTVITETDHEVSTQKISDGFLSLDAADNLPNSSILDLICVLVSVNPIIQNATSKRREIVVTNELMETTIVTLWGDFAENDGAFLDKLKDDKPILGLCDIRVSIYKGIQPSIAIPVSSVLINPIFQKAIDLRAWHEIIETDNKDITVAPTKAMRRSIE